MLSVLSVAASFPLLSSVFCLPPASSLKCYIRPVAQRTTPAGEWYDQVAKSRPPKDDPWYHVLVDGSDQVTYVAERNLEPDSEEEAIRHPLLEEFFSSFESGEYLPRLPN